MYDHIISLLKIDNDNDMIHRKLEASIIIYPCSK